MAFDETLAERIRDHLASNPDISEKKMFGGLAFLLHGNMSVAVSGDSLMVRVGTEHYEEALSEPGVSDTGTKMKKPMNGWVWVGASQLSDNHDLGRWVERGLAFAGTLDKK